MRRKVVAVVGNSAATEEACGLARELGRALVDQGYRVVTGGMTGVMEAASLGAPGIEHLEWEAPVRAGDRLFVLEGEAELYSFEPHPVPPDTYGFILAKLDTDVTQITQYSSVIINLGAQEGLEPGHVLAIYGKERTIADPISGGTVRLPGERSGLVMVYKVHDLVSYALVMQAERTIRLQDRVMTP